LATVTEQYHAIGDLVLDGGLIERLEYIIEENGNIDRLLEYGLKPKQKILLCGPPGTGKTLSSKVLASSVGIPLVRVEFDSLISSLLGETGSNLRKIFELAERTRCVVLFDEFDVVAKSRDDTQEHGEMKRVISSFMQMVDSYNGRGMIVAATNHQHLLDPAVWRRFDDILLYERPDASQRSELLVKYLAALGARPGAEARGFARQTAGFSAADIARICEDMMRRSILAGRRGVRGEDLAWAIAEQKRRKRAMRGS
ncbi:MAG: ATP-binding protein, partial [Nitrosopumilus sp.]|nr:ATP-binding protein [Nitrosopumilus sp.]MDA7974478.1 ATP-binding protein [Nitrosopumilus sp.]